MIKQVYQKLIFPKILNKDDYYNPYSSTNTSGDISKAYALFQLIDPVNLFETKYSPSAASFSQTYKSMLQRIDTHGNAENILAEALEKINTKEFVALGPGTQDFYLIETEPYNLFENDGTHIEFSVGPPDSGADFVEIHSEEKRQISFYGFFARIIRPWYTHDVFGGKNWTIQGCSVGAYSDGTYSNSGVLPLLPIELVISINEKGELCLQAVISDIIPKTPCSAIPYPQAHSGSWVFAKEAKNTIDINRIANLPESLLMDEYGKPINPREQYNSGLKF